MNNINLLENKNNMPAQLTITFGPMFSGKTSNLIENIANKQIISSIKGESFKGLVVNHKCDIRSDTSKIENLTTHNNVFGDNVFPENIDFKSSTSLSEILEILMTYDHISIDEAQFFPDLEKVVLQLLEHEKDIHVVGLITDSDLKPFGQLSNLFPYADDIVHKKAYCVYCKDIVKNASFTKNVGKSKKQQVMVSSKKDYVPSCRYHHKTIFE